MEDLDLGSNLRLDSESQVPPTGRSMRRFGEAARFGEHDGVSQKSRDEQEGMPVDGTKDAPSQDDSNDEVRCNR